MGEGKVEHSLTNAGIRGHRWHIMVTLQPGCLVLTTDMFLTPVCSEARASMSSYRQHPHALSHAHTHTHTHSLTHTRAGRTLHRLKHSGEKKLLLLFSSFFSKSKLGGQQISASWACNSEIVMEISSQRTSELR